MVRGRIPGAEGVMRVTGRGEEKVIYLLLRCVRRDAGCGNKGCDFFVCERRRGPAFALWRKVCVCMGIGGRAHMEQVQGGLLGRTKWFV